MKKMKTARPIIPLKMLPLLYLGIRQVNADEIKKIKLFFQVIKYEN